MKGKDCWEGCYKKGGFARGGACEDYCGTGMSCCRKTWNQHTPCAGTYGCDNKHCCTATPAVGTAVLLDTTAAATQAPAKKQTGLSIALIITGVVVLVLGVALYNDRQ